MAEGGPSTLLDRMRDRALGAALWLCAGAFIAALLSQPPIRLRWHMTHWTLACAAAALLCGLEWRAATGDRRRRLGWFTAGFTFNALGQLAWDLQVLGGWNPFPAPSDVFFILLGPCLGLGVIQDLHHLNPKTRSAAWLDIAALSALGLALVLALYVPLKGAASPAALAVLAAHPAVLLGAVGSVLVAVLAQRCKHQGPLLFLVGLGALAWIWMRWNLITLTQGLPDNAWWSGLFSAAVLLLGAAASRWDPPLEEQGSGRLRFFLWNALPVMIALAAGLALSVAPDLGPGASDLLRACALLAVACAVLRQSLVVLEREERLQAEAQARESEERLRAVSVTQAEAQRLQALGTLAGGVAHEFNNILMAVYSQLELAEKDASAEPIRLAKGATNRGRDVIRRILDFARQDEGGAKLSPLSLAAAVDEAMLLLRPLLPPTVHLRLEDEAPGAQALAQASGLQQVLLNLGLNSGQALGERPGELRFRIRTRYLLAGALHGLPAGEYAELCVIDDGPGMEEAVRLRAFEPFFSTKGPGQGSGLGLAVVHGIVTRWGGWVACESAPGRGACITVLLPSAGSTPSVTAAPVPEQAWPGGEVLVLDDEPLIARALQRLLERKGYKVVSLTEPQSALDLLARQPGRFKILITDMSMPGLSGREVLLQSRRLDPGLAVVLSTGSVDLDREGEGFDATLEKPYSLEQLELALRRAAAVRP